MAAFVLPPETLVHGRYRIVGPIGRGGMGAVYEAIDERLGHHVALKQMLVEGEVGERAFEREARLLAGLRHPALPAVSDYFEEVTGRFLVMQFIPGKTLAEMAAARGGPFSLDEVLGWADQLLDALEHLHGRQPPILHRDIKPANLKLTSDGHVVLLDFGLAKGSGETTSLGLGLGPSVFGLTPQYAPLEQFQGWGTEAVSDLFALGGTLYFLLAHAPPVDAVTRASAVGLGKADPLRPIAELNDEVPARVGAWLTKALALHKEDRFADASVMRRELAKTRTAAIVMPPPTVALARAAFRPAGAPATLPPPPAERGGGPVVWLVAAFAALLLVLVAVDLLVPGRSTPPASPGSASGAEITSDEGDGFEFQWAGDDYWVLSRGGQRLDTYKGSVGAAVAPGTYRIAPISEPVFEPIDFIVTDDAKTVVKRPSGRFEFRWNGDDYWALFRGTQRVATHQGTAGRVVMPGAYRIAPNSEPVFEPIAFTVEKGEKTIVERLSGRFEFRWDGDDYWALFRGTQRVATHQGTAGRVVMPGAYRIAPNSEPVFEPIEFIVTEGQKTLVTRPSGSFELQWAGDDHWVLFRGAERVATHHGSATRVVMPGAYRVAPNSGTPFAPVDFTVTEGQKTVVQPR